MKYYVRGRAYIFRLIKKSNYDSIKGMPCGTIVEASSKEKAQEKGLKKLKKELSSFQEIKIIEVSRVTKDYPNTLD